MSSPGRGRSRARRRRPLAAALLGALAPAVTTAVPECAAVTGLSPDWQGRVRFATGGGVVGTADDRTGTVRTLALPAGERVANSVSTAPEGTAVTTTHATHLLTAAADGTPETVWRRAYRLPGRRLPPRAR